MRCNILSVLFVLQLVLIAFLSEMPSKALAQEPSFELPVQIVGFPVIILAVRISNFVKKLAYSLDPNTYRRRARRAVLGAEYDVKLDVIEAEKKLMEEFGEGVCVYERICSHYAARAQRTKTRDSIDWETVLSQYKKSPDTSKEYYLLSVFLGDIVASPNLCHHLAKRRPCTPSGGWEQR